MRCVVGSKSKRKINTTEKIIRDYLKDEDITVEGCDAMSGMPETPWGKQTFDGAKNRAIDSKVRITGADYYIGLESGLVERFGHVYEEAWCVIIASDGKEYLGYSSGLKVPDCILNKMDELKMEHCDVMKMFEKKNLDSPNDTWGTYTSGVLAREISLEEAIRNTVIQVLTGKNFYKEI